MRPGQKYPQASHPIITRHPETGRSLLSVNKSFTSHVEGIPRWESDMLLSGLYDFVAKNARVQCRVKWTPNTLVMWDNRCVQHQAVRDYVGFARYGERVSILDGKPPRPHITEFWVILRVPSGCVEIALRSISGVKERL